MRHVASAEFFKLRSSQFLEKGITDRSTLVAATNDDKLSDRFMTETKKDQIPGR